MDELQKLIKEAVDGLKTTREEVKEQIKAQNDKIDARMQEITEKGQETPETKAALKAHGDKLKELFEKMDAFQKQIDDAMVEAKRIGDPISNKAPLTIDQLIVKHEGFEEALKRQQSIEKFEIKTDELMASFYDSATNTIKPTLGTEYFLPNVVEPPRKRTKLLDLIPTVTLDKSITSIKYVQQVGYGGAIISISVDKPIGTTVFEVDSTNGVHLGQEVEVGGVVAKVTAYDRIARTVTIDKPSTVAVTAADDVIKAKTVGGTPWGQRKPNVDFGIEHKNTQFITIAAMKTISLQAYESVAYVQDMIKRHLRYIHEDTLEFNIMHGANEAGVTMSGLLHDPNRQIVLWSNGDIGDTKIDAILEGVAASDMTGYAPDTVLLSTRDYTDVMKTKNNNGDYIYSDPSACGTQKMWCMDIVSSNRMVTGRAVVTNFGENITLYNHGIMKFETSREHAYNFGENMITLRLEGDYCLVITAPDSIVEVVFDGAPVPV